MTEGIIIDGVNVAGCQCFATAHVVMTASGILVKDIDNACTVKQKPCEEIKDCMFKRQFKQLKRLEQENNILKEKLQIAQNSDKKTLDILQENLHLKEQLEPFKDKYFKGLTNGTIAGLAKKSIRMTAENIKYTNFLEWLLIQQYYILPPKIKTRINEVLNETAK